MSPKHAGRHRAPGFNPINELAGLAAQTAQPAMKASAVAVASGGLIATFALPAAASPGDVGRSALGLSSSQSASFPGVLTPGELTVAAVSTVAVAAPAKPADAPSFGVIGFTASVAPAAAAAVMEINKVAPAPVAAPVVAVSRSAVRTAAPRPTAAAAPTPAAPAVNLPAPTGGILGIAAGLSGIPYVYGGTSTSGFDCSGFTGYVYRLAGKSIPRTAEAQRAASVKVSNPSPGDLIFFGVPAYHVGIYAGPGMMYDAQHPGTTTGLHSIWTYNSVSYGRF